MPPLEAVAGASALIERLDRAVTHESPRRICRAVKAALSEAELELSDELLAESAERYARRLLYRCPDGTYSVLVMVWAPGQGTPIHDHAGKWCVECVYRGRMQITTYRPTSDPTDDLVSFAQTGTEVAGPGDVGIFVPPNEYHRIRNAGDETAATLHVYAGEMLWCHAFHEVAPGQYRKERLTLRYFA